MQTSHPFAAGKAVVAGATEHAIFMTDPRGIIFSWNVGVERVLGYAEGDWIGQHVSLVFTPEDFANGEVEREMENAVQNGRAEDIRWHVRRDTRRYCSASRRSP